MMSHPILKEKHTMRQFQIRTAEGKKVTAPELNCSIGYNGKNQETEVRKVQRLLREVYAKGHFKGHFGADLIELLRREVKRKSLIPGS